jgi:hypothetical protein
MKDLLTSTHNHMYLQACAQVSDIHVHLPVLKAYADLCDHVTEFGVRDGQSSRALWASHAHHIRMYDLFLNDQVSQHVHSLQQAGRDCTYTQADTRLIQIEPTDLLFIDTLHTYDQLKTELHMHGDQVRKFMAFHDTHTFGLKDEPGYTGPGLLPALLEWLGAHPEWRICHHEWRCNGFTVLERCSHHT